MLGAGGSVIPRWETAKPSWFPEEFYWVVGCTYVGLPETRAPIRNPFGGAMCVRREIFETVGGFSEEIGRLRGNGAVHPRPPTMEIFLRTVLFRGIL